MVHHSRLMASSHGVMGSRCWVASRMMHGSLMASSHGMVASGSSSCCSWMVHGGRVVGRLSRVVGCGSGMMASRGAARVGLDGWLAVRVVHG